jgi:hypothetical protein
VVWSSGTLLAYWLRSSLYSSITGRALSKYKRKPLSISTTVSPTLENDKKDYKPTD